jgi:hypothetical protein
MSTHSSFANSAALGGWDRPNPILLAVDEPARSGSPTLSIASGPSRPILRPVTDPTTTGQPTTGGSRPIIGPVLQPNPPVVTATGDSAPLVRMNGSTVVINGRHHIEKRHLALIGGGLVGAVLLYKLVL